MIVNSDTLDTSGEDLLNPIIGWENLVAVSNISTTTEEVGFPATNLANPATHLFWRAIAAGNEYITVVVSDTVDFVAVARHNFGTADIVTSVEVATTDSPSDWVEVVAAFQLGDDGAVLFRFVPQSIGGIRLRLQEGTAAAEAAVIYVGRLLVCERSIKIDVDHTPFNLGKVTKIISGRSEAGNFLGRTVINSKGVSTADFSHFTPAWYRENFHPFVLEAQESPFFFAWNPSEYPLEIDYAWIAEDPMPEIDPVTRRVSVRLKMEGLTTRSRTLGFSIIGLPSGALGVWYFDEAAQDDDFGGTEIYHVAIPNEATATPIARNFWWMGADRTFNGIDGLTNVTVGGTDHFGDQPDRNGNNFYAARVTSGNGAWGFFRPLTSIPSSGNTGIYTIGCWAKKISGVGDKFKFVKFFGTTEYSAEKTVTGTWTRFSHTFTTFNNAVPDFGFGHDNSPAATGFVMDVSDVTFYAGAVDLGAETLAGHMYAIADANTVFAGNIGTFLSTPAIMQWPSQNDTSELTCLVCAQKLTQVGGNQYRAWISGLDDDSLFFGRNVSGGPGDCIGFALGAYNSGGNVVYGPDQFSPDLYDPTNAGFVVYGGTFDASDTNRVDMWLNGIKLATSTDVGVAFNPNIRSLYLNWLAHFTHPSNNAYQSVVIYNRKLTDDEMRQASASLMQRASTKGVTIDDPKILLVDGDQVTNSGETTPYPYEAANLVTDKIRGCVYSQTNSTIANLASRVSNITDITSITQDHQIVVLIDAGRFEAGMGTGSPATAASALATYLDSLESDGVTRIVATLIDFQHASQSQFNTDRAAFNTIVGAWVGIHCEAVLDLATVTNLGANGDHLNATYFTGDGIRLTDVGAALAAAELAALLDTL